MKKLISLVPLMLFAFLLVPQTTAAQEADPRMTYHLNNNLSAETYINRLSKVGAIPSGDVSFPKQAAKRNKVKKTRGQVRTRTAFNQTAVDAVSRNNHANFLNESSDMPVRTYHLNRCDSRFHSRHFGTTSGYYSFCR